MPAPVVIDVGDMPVLLRTGDLAMRALLNARFRPFLNPVANPVFEFDVRVTPDSPLEPDADLEVRRRDSCWSMRRGDFRAQWDGQSRRGWIETNRSPFAIDSVLRIVHSLMLSTARGFLLHASSVVRNGKAFLFTGPSGAGKTTIARLAPPDVAILTDEISYVKWVDGAYVAFGTPFVGDLGEPGEAVRAPVAALFRLAHGSTNDRERLGVSDAVRTLMRNILFFADDGDLVGHVLDTACHFADRVPAYGLTFTPDPAVWEMIR